MPLVFKCYLEMTVVLSHPLTFSLNDRTIFIPVNYRHFDFGGLYKKKVGSKMQQTQTEPNIFSTTSINHFKHRDQVIY